MSVEQERSFLQPFFARAAQGEIATAEDIQRAFEAQVKHAVHSTSSSRLLDRRSLRKLVPRPPHPKAHPEAQAAVKNTLRRRFKRHWPHAILLTEAPCERWPRDEGRFGRVSIPRRAWVPPGVRPQAPQHIVGEYTPVYAAVAPAHGHNDLAHCARG